MGRVTLMTSTAAPPVTATTTTTAAVPVEAQALSVDGDFAGVCWHHRPGAEVLLAELRSEAWTRPEEQGWERIKTNPRREVWRAEIGDRTVYLKYHYAARGLRGVMNALRRPVCRTEWDVGMFALRHDIAAIRPVAYTTDLQRDGRRCALLITEAVERARPLNEFWELIQSDPDARGRRNDVAQLVERLAELIARAHQAGFEHLDMHAANILVRPTGPRQYEAVFVDLQSARRDVPIRAKAVIRNLAQLNQWFRKHSTIGDRLRFLRSYLRWRNEFEIVYDHGHALPMSFRRLVQALKRAAEMHARRLWAQRDRRLRRRGRYFTTLRLVDGWRGMVVLGCKHALDASRASQMAFDVQWWQDRLTQVLQPDPDGEDCKNSHSATVRRTKLSHDAGVLPAIVKQPRARNGWRRIVQMLPPSRAARGWQRGHMLLHRDIATARPLAFVERRRGPLVYDSVLLNEALPAAIDLDHFLREEFAVRGARRWRQLKITLLPTLVRHVRRLFDRGFVHRDCKASNILAVMTPDAPTFVWIDMDGIRPARRVRRHDIVRALTRLHVSLREVPGLTRTDRVRFLKLYCARFGASTDAWRPLWHEIAQATDRKLEQQAARRAWKLRHYGRT